MTEADDEDLVRDAIRAANPLRGQPPLSMGVTAAELRARAALSEPAKRRQRFRLRQLIASLVALAVLFALMGGMWLGVRLFPQPQIGPSDWPTDLPHAVSAAAVLYAVAESIQSSEVDAQTGSVTYIEIERWQHLDSSRDVKDVAGTYERRWRATDGSGRVAEQSMFVDVAQTFDRARVGKRELAGVEPNVRDYSPGELTGYFDALGEPSTNPARLARQLTAQQCGVTMLRPSPCPPTAIHGDLVQLLFDAITSLHRTEIPTLELRRALLTALGGTPGVMSQGIVTDPLGREGVAVLYMASGVTRTLVFDLRSGELLVSDTVVHGGPGLSHYVLHISRARPQAVG